MSQNLNIWDVFWTNQVQMDKCSRNVVSGRRVADAIRSLVNARDLQLECAKVFLYMAVRQCYGRWRDLELWVCR